MAAQVAFATSHNVRFMENLRLFAFGDVRHVAGGQGDKTTLPTMPKRVSWYFRYQGAFIKIWQKARQIFTNLPLDTENTNS
ncbi:hypothetical protein C7N83_10005 [Neisseria iguanae]|uniref:Uncharacterized protein n=1 Tax=Neisseria iguanae TaxID=90242 RepID=A0A2P7TYT2_9NEIS|nr:hypothetical protein C7N83_10005 [Neisseria iguanae]